MEQRVVRVGTLAEFTEEVRLPRTIIPGFEPGKPVVRLSLTDQWVGGSVIPKKELRLHLQGINGLGEIVWLVESHTIVCFPSGPETPRDASIAAGMRIVYELVKAHLEALGYEVRGGSYGIPEDIKPVMGALECVCWRKADEEGRWVVEMAALTQDPPSPQPSPSKGEGAEATA